MKKIILITAATLLVSAACFAQTADKYADLVVYQPALKNYVAELHVNGNTNKEQTTLKDNAGNKMKFPDEAHALNYVAQQGWELISAYYNKHEDATHFILKRG